VKFYEVFVIKVTWDNGLGPLVGPVVGVTVARRLCTAIRKRLKANNHPFKSVHYERLDSVRWLFGFDFMQDPVDRLLASVGEQSYNMIEQGYDPRK
jgi:hypothetical protein